MSNRSIAKKDVAVGSRTFTVRIDSIKPVEEGHYVEVWWSVTHLKDVIETSFKLMEYDELLTAASYNFETGSVRKVVLARKLLGMLRVGTFNSPNYFEFNFYDNKKGAAGETLGDISESLYIDLTRP